MPVKIRLQRHGKKGRPFYHIVAADARSKRDGKFIEKLGTYNPNVNPAEINLNLDRAFHWLQVGAQPTDTAKAILSYKGAIYKNHLAKGVAKGAFSQEEADKRFDAWLAEKEAKVQAKVDSLKSADDQAKAKILAREKEINEARAAAITAAQSPLVEAPAEVAAEAVADAGDAAEEVAETAAEVAEEAPAAAEEVKEEAAEVVEEVKAEATETVEEAKEEVAEAAVEAKEEVAEAAEEAKEETAEEGGEEEEKA